MGYRDIFQYVVFSWYFCEVNFCVTILRYFCEVLLVARGFIWFPLHMTMVWYLARGALIGGDGDSQLHRRLEDIGHRANE